MMNNINARLIAATAACFVSASCGFQHTSSSPLTPTAPTAPIGGGATSAPQTYVDTWVSQSLSQLPNASSCTSLQWHVTSQTATTLAGDFSAACGNVSINGSAEGRLEGTFVPMKANGSASVLNVPACTFSLTGTGNIENNNAIRVEYTGTTCFGPVSGTEVLRRKSSAPPATQPPTPEPTPPPPLPPPPTPPSPDMIDLGQATIRNSPSDVASWPQTATITLLDLQASGAHIEFTRQNDWPNVTYPGWDGPLQYTLWIVLNINGRWYASGCVEYWKGLERSGGPPSGYARDWYYDPIRWSPMSGYQPAVGEQVGFLVTAGDARNNGGTVLKERSNVVVVPFPSDGGGAYPFSVRGGTRFNPR